MGHTAIYSFHAQDSLIEIEDGPLNRLGIDSFGQLAERVERQSHRGVGFTRTLGRGLNGYDGRGRLATGEQRFRKSE
jgi:hypothetical protein